jgi:hypothetical protein
MSSDPKMRMPYGPGWEDPDWSPHATPPDESAAPQWSCAEDTRPVAITLTQFMAVVKRFARSLPSPASARRPAIPPPSPYPGPTRRWVMAGGAGLVALAALPGSRTGAEESGDEQAKISLRESHPEGDSAAELRRGKT